MVGDEKERWMQLCELATQEQDPIKLMELVAEINRILEAKEHRLKETSDTALEEPPTPAEGSQR